MTTFDPRTEKNLKTLLPEAERQMRVFLAALVPTLPAGVTVQVLSGLRTFADQDKLFNERPQRTKARGGFSWHNYAVAADLGFFKGGEYLKESPLYAKAGNLAESLGLEWGGSWKSFRNEPHVQCRTGLTLAEARALYYAEKGKELPILPLKGEATRVKTETERVRVNPPVTIYRQGENGPEETEVPAFYENSRVWVEAAGFTREFGGGVSNWNKAASTVTLSLNDRVLTASARLISGHNYVRFHDINAVLDYKWQFVGQSMRLTVMP